MPDYKELYLKMFRAAGQAVDLMIAAQRECEEDYISSPEPSLRAVSLPPEREPDADEG